MQQRKSVFTSVNIPNAFSAVDPEFANMGDAKPNAKNVAGAVSVHMASRSFNAVCALHIRSVLFMALRIRVSNAKMSFAGQRRSAASKSTS
jgi:hypothetical protein